MNLALKRTLKLTILFFLGFILVLWEKSPVFAQIPFISSPSAVNPTISSASWDLNQAYPCGRYWCSDVYIYDGNTEDYNLLTPEFTLTAAKGPEQSITDAKQVVEQRARVVQRVFQKIVNDIAQKESKKLKKSKSITSDSENWLFWLPSTKKPPYPLTPIVDVGFKNNQTVIYVPDQPQLGITAQDIVTITEIDATVKGETMEALASQWRLDIRDAFSQALWGRELDIQHPQWRWRIVFLVMGVMISLLVGSYYLHEVLRKWNNRLRYKLQKITEAIAATPHEISSQTVSENKDLKDNLEVSDQPALKQDSVKNKSDSIPVNHRKSLGFLKRFARQTIDLANQTPISHLTVFLKRQTLISQQQNFCQLLLRLLFLINILIIAFGLTTIVFTFRSTRFLSVYLLRETIILIILWTSLIFIDKIVDFFLDFLLNRWANEKQIIDPNSNRYALRVDTYSKTFKSATTVLTIFIGTYSTIWILGVNPAILASAGVFAVGLAFLSRSLLEDLLNGMLILVNDRYVIGDVIDAGGGLVGGVEDMNLFTTSLRNTDGQLIAIPNRKIESVINFSKNWSQVNFSIRIAYNENVDKAIKVMKQVAEEMQSEPLWDEKCLQPAEVLGVDDISYEGILIRMIIKTLPKEQSIVGREYRLRLKKAFEKEGISLGIPYHKISLISPYDNSI